MQMCIVTLCESDAALPFYTVGPYLQNENVEWWWQWYTEAFSRPRLSSDTRLNHSYRHLAFDNIQHGIPLGWWPCTGLFCCNSRPFWLRCQKAVPGDYHSSPSLWSLVYRWIPTCFLCFGHVIEATGSGLLETWNPVPSTGWCRALSPFISNLRWSCKQLSVSDLSTWTETKSKQDRGDAGWRKGHLVERISFPFWGTLCTVWRVVLNPALLLANKKWK